MAVRLTFSHRFKRIIVGVLLLAGVIAWLFVNPKSYESEVVSTAADKNTAGEDGSRPPAAVEPLGENAKIPPNSLLATEVLEKLQVKGRAPKTGYARTEFYSGWPDVEGCSLRQRIIKREVGASAKLDGCDVVAGTFTEPYTGEIRHYTTKSEFAKHIQIDHIVALSDAWQKGAQYLPKETRYQIATDPLNLVAADGPANMQKGDADAATWLPANKAFRCEYVARQISVKYKYALWVTDAEKSAMAAVLVPCPSQIATGIDQF